jgi:hypothetical protein
MTPLSGTPKISPNSREGNMTRRRIVKMKALFTFLLVTCLVITLYADQSKNKYSKQEIKDLISSVWQASELDLNNFRDYVFCEREVHECKLLDGTWEGLRLQGMPPQSYENYRREYVWVIRDNHFVRSLTRLNGAEVSAQQQKDYEEQWIKEEQKRAKAKSGLEYFFLSDSAVGNPGSFKQMKEGNYKFKAEATLGKRKVIMLQADYSSPLSVGYAFFIAPEENRFVQFDAILKGFGKYSMIMGQPIDKTWLPLICTGSFEFSHRALSLPSNRLIPACHYISKHSREFYSFKKSHVKAKLWFEDVNAETGRYTEKPQ